MATPINKIPPGFATFVSCCDGYMKATERFRTLIRAALADGEALDDEQLQRIASANAGLVRISGGIKQILRAFDPDQPPPSPVEHNPKPPAPPAEESE